MYLPIIVIIFLFIWEFEDVLKNAYHSQSQKVFVLILKNKYHNCFSSQTKKEH